MPPAQTTRSIRHAVFLDALDDRARAERGRLDQRAIDLGAGRVERLAEKQAGQQLIDEDGAVAVVPVEREQAGLAGLLLGPRRVSCCVQRGVAAADALDPPLENVADRRLAGLDAEIAGQDRALHDAADAGNVGDAACRRTPRRSRRSRCRSP